ncbi:MAG: radical SAM protein [Deltaproteobacteria bacterium]
MWRIGKDLGLFARMAVSLRPRVAAFHARYELARWARGSIERDGVVVPTALYVETSSYCRGRCRGCYVPVAERTSQRTLDAPALQRIIASARRLRPDYVCLVGGEPLDGPALEINLALIEGAPDLRFFVCTGLQGRSDEGLMRRLAALTNLSVFFSVDGLATTHDRIRSRGSHARTLAAMRSYNGRGGQVCGASVTLREENREEVTAGPFVASLESAGCNVVSFDPWFSADGGESLAPDALWTSIERLRRIAQTSPSMFFVNPFGRLRSDGFDAETAMLAASIDSLGNVYGSRRGRPLGNLATEDLDTILAGDGFQRGFSLVDRVACALDDPRRGLIEQTAVAMGLRALQ